MKISFEIVEYLAAAKNLNSFACIDKILSQSLRKVRFKDIEPCCKKANSSLICLIVENSSLLKSYFCRYKLTLQMESFDNQMQSFQVA